MPKLAAYPALPPRAIARGATSPNPGKLYALAFSTIENDAVIWNGTSWSVAGASQGVTAKLLGVTGMVAGVHYYATPAGGGEAGLATGFGLALLAIFGPPSGDRLDRWTPGYALHRHGTSGDLYFFVVDGGGTSRSVQLSVPSFFWGRVLPVVARFDGSAISLSLALGAHRASLAVTGLTPAAGSSQQILGNNNAPPSATEFLAWAEFRGNPTDAQLLAYLLQARTDLDLPLVLTGATGNAPTHVHSVKRALAGQLVTDGQVGPASIPDAITAAAVDLHTRGGSPTVKVRDMAVDGRKSYGVMGFAANVVLQTALGAGFRGQAAGFTLRLPVTFGSIAGSPGYLASCWTGSGARGWALQLSSATLYFYVANVAVIKTLSAADLGFPRLLHVVHNGSTFEAFIDGVSVGVSAAAPFTAEVASQPMTIGGINVPAGWPAVSDVVWGLAGANYVATAAEVAADFASWKITARLANITASKPDANRYETSLDIAPAPDAVPAQILDRVGTDHLTRVGTGLQVSRRTERMWSYESTPVLRGARNWSAANYMSVATQLAQTAVPFWFAFAFVVTAKAGGTFQGIISKASNSTPLGFNCYTSSNNAVLNCTFGNGSTFLVAPTYNIADADVGKVLLVGYQWTGSVIQAFVKRGRSGGDVTAAAFAPFTGALTLGRHSDTTGNPATDNLSIHDVWAGINTNLTLAEWQSLYDSYVSEESAIAVPGKTSRIWRIGDTGSLVAVADALGSGETLSPVGAPTLAEVYARAVAA